MSQSYLKMDTTLTDIHKPDAFSFAKDNVSILLKNGYHSDFELVGKKDSYKKSQSYLKMDTTLTFYQRNFRFLKGLNPT